MKVLIQGAGIAGLSLAAALREKGIESLIVEKAPELRPVGAGITLGSNALRSLSTFLDPEPLIKAGVVFDRLILQNESGKILSEIPSRIGDQALPAVALKRSRLHEELAKKIDSRSLRLASEISDLEIHSDKVVARLTSGETVVADYLVAADGLHSALRAKFFGRVQSIYSGYTCWRALIDATHAMTSATEIWGAGRRLGLVPVSDHELYIYVTLNLKAGEGRNFGKDRVAELFRSFPQFRPFETSLERARFIQNDIEEISESVWGSGKLLMIGDAAHAITPNLGQGAALGIEDAVVLTDILAAGSKEPLADLRKARKARVDWIGKMSRDLGQIGQWEKAWAVKARDLLLAATPASVMKRNLRRILNHGI